MSLPDKTAGGIALVKKAAAFAEKHLSAEKTGHDWWHTQRVWKAAVFIAKEENADIFTCEIAALLHDIDDWKISDSPKVPAWLQKHIPDETFRNKIIQIIDKVSFKGAGVFENELSAEAKVVQDADRLDAIGAMGIARAFAYGGSKGRAIFQPEVSPVFHASFDEYKNNKTHTINHFYEKLLLIYDRLHTKTAKRIAFERQLFLEQYLKQFYKEWNCEFPLK